MPALPTKTTAQIKIEFARKENRTFQNPIASTRYGLARDEPSAVADITQQLKDNQFWIPVEWLTSDISFAQSYKQKQVIPHDDFTHYLTSNKRPAIDTNTRSSENIVWTSKFYRDKFRHNTTMQLEITYPSEILASRKDNKGYLVEIYSPTEYPDDGNMFIKAIENEMESTKQVNKPKNLTMLVERSPFTFDTLPVLPNHKA